MQSKLTLRLGDELIRVAKACSSRHGTSVSVLVEGVFTAIREGSEPFTVTPAVRELTSVLAGVLAGTCLNKDDFRNRTEARRR